MAAKVKIIQSDSIWQQYQSKDRFANATFNVNEFCMRRIYMPDYIQDLIDEHIVDDYAPKP